MHHPIQFRLHLSMIHLTSQHTNSQLKFPPRLPSYNTKLAIGASMVCTREFCAQLSTPLGGSQMTQDYKILGNLVFGSQSKNKKAPPNHSLPKRKFLTVVGCVYSTMLVIVVTYLILLLR